MKKTLTNFIRLLTGKKGTVYLIICMAAAVSLTSCKKNTAASGLQKQKAMADSIMRHIDDTTAVKYNPQNKTFRHSRTSRLFS